MLPVPVERLLPGADIAVRFPTSNTALLNDRPQDFYMYVDRNFEGQKSQPWQAVPTALPAPWSEPRQAR